MQLQRLGYLCIEAVDGIDALRKLAENRVDMIITDIHMPNMNGLDLVNEVRTSCKFGHIPIVVLSVEGSDTIKSQARAAGVNGWLTKPFQFDRFMKFANLFFGQP